MALEQFIREYYGFTEDPATWELDDPFSYTKIVLTELDVGPEEEDGCSIYENCSVRDTEDEGLYDIEHAEFSDETKITFMSWRGNYEKFTIHDAPDYCNLMYFFQQMTGQPFPRKNFTATVWTRGGCMGFRYV